jgi:hypothetical protein
MLLSIIGENREKVKGIAGKLQERHRHRGHGKAQPRRDFLAFSGSMPGARLAIMERSEQ